MRSGAALEAADDVAVDVSPLPALTSLLPPAQAEFLVMADTHLVDTRAEHAREFSSRLRQNDRVLAALRVAAGTGGGTVMHLGDLVQDYPGAPLHERLLLRAVRQVRDIAARVWFAPGNTDVGDQHDPSSPGPVASPEAMERFTRAAGGYFAAVDVGPVRAIVLAASLFNSGLGLEVEQWDWLEAELGAAADCRVSLFFHYPLFLKAANDPGIGNYDVINEPARSRLVALVQRFGVEAVFTGHSHFAFFNRIGTTRAFGVPSTSFTRPGFSELFSSAAPPDQGRDDVPKLGFQLARVHPDGIRVHQVRTGMLAERADGQEARPVVSCAPNDIPDSRLGVVLRHPIAGFAEVPDTFPSVVRQPVRNDYPLLACLELGVRHVSVSAADVCAPELAERLQALRDEGVSVTARVVWAEGEVLALPHPDSPVDEVELVLLGRASPTSADLAELTRIPTGRGLIVSTLMRRAKGGAELPRWRYGLTIAEAADLDAVLAMAHTGGVRVLLSIDGTEETAQTVEFIGRHSWVSVDGADVVTPVGSDGLDEAGRLAESFLLACAGRSVRFFVDGLTELDRTLDLSAGLLDRAHNPRPAFHALRVLNSLVHGDCPASIERVGTRYEVRRGDLRAVIAISGEAPGGLVDRIGDADLVALAEGVVLPTPTVSAAGPLMWLAQTSEGTGS